MELKDIQEVVENGLKETSGKWDSKLQEKANEIVKSIEEKGFTKKEDIETAVKAAQKEMQDQFDTLATKMNKQKVTEENLSFEAQIKSQLESNLEGLKGIKGDKNGSVVLNVKAAATQTTANVTLPTATPVSFTYQDTQSVIPLTEKVPFVQDFTDNAPTNKVALPWVEEVSMEGDAAFIGEGVVKPLMDIDYQVKYSEAKKVAGKIKVSEEALTDIPFMTAEINRKLKQRHDLAKQDGILNGDGTGANLKGITEYAAAFAAGGLAAAIENAQNYDVIVATYNQILVTSDSNYIPSAVFVHPTDATLMRLTKDADGNYLMPPFSGPNGEVVNGVRVVQNTKIPLGYFLMGDFSKSHVRDYVNFSIRIGYTGDDFEKNLVTILGESRVHHYISSNESKAFVYDQFSVAKTALEVVPAT